MAAVADDGGIGIAELTELASALPFRRSDVSKAIEAAKDRTVAFSWSFPSCRGVVPVFLATGAIAAGSAYRPKVESIDTAMERNVPGSGAMTAGSAATQ